MVSIIRAYFKYLESNPGRIDSIFQWTLCTFVAWFFIWKYRNRIIQGMEGMNLLFESGEVIAFISIVCFPPTLFNMAFFKGTELYQWYALLVECGLFACTLYGRYIFDWALAFKSGASSVPVVSNTQSVKSTQEVTESHTETKNN